MTKFVFKKELKSYLKYIEWYDGLSEKKKNYMRLVEKYQSMTR